jgi:hypothetical protein
MLEVSKGGDFMDFEMSYDVDFLAFLSWKLFWILFKILGEFLFLTLLVTLLKNCAECHGISVTRKF